MTNLFILFLDIYSYFVNCFNFLSNICFKIKKSIMNNQISYLAVYTKDCEYKLIYDCENMNIIILLLYIGFHNISKVPFFFSIDEYIYMCDKLSYKDNEIKYFICTFYHDNNRYNVIHSQYNNIKVHLKVAQKNVKNRIAYCMVGKNHDITKYFNDFIPSLITEKLLVHEYLFILTSFKNVLLHGEEIILLDMNKMQEQTFKRNDVIAL